MNYEHYNFHLQYKHSGTFANYKSVRNCLTPKNSKMCDPILVTLSQSSRENATPSSGTSPLTSYKKVSPPPGRLLPLGAFHSTKTSGMKFRVFHVTNGTVFSGWFEPSRPSPSRTNFRAKIRNKQGNQKMADSLSILLALELLDDYEVEISEVLDEDDDITLFSVGSSYMRRNLNRVRDYFEGTIPLYFPDEFKGHFRMTRETCELFTRAVMPTGRIPLGNGSGRAAIPPPKQVLAFLWCMANQEPARAVADRFDITLSSVDRVLKRVSQAAIDLSGQFIRWPNGEFL